MKNSLSVETTFIIFRFGFVFLYECIQLAPFYGYYYFHIDCLMRVSGNRARIETETQTKHKFVWESETE